MVNRERYLISFVSQFLFIAFAYFPAAMAQDKVPSVLVLPLPDDSAVIACAAVKSSEASVEGSAITLHRSFLDDFLDASLNRQKWQTHFEGDGNRLSQRSLPANHEKEIYVDPAYPGIGFTPLKLDPFSLHNGVLNITESRTPEELRSRLYDQPFTSGVITTIDSFKQKYGYFEIRAKIPHGKGLWPAFWLLQPKWHWPPEIDILEVTNGQKPEEIVLTTHWKDDGVGANKQSYCFYKVSGSDTEFHLYGALWTSERIVYYVDRKPVVQMMTPPGLDQPMYMLANLAVQSVADESTPTPASLEIDWIVAYTLNDPEKRH
jgi:beta-glucanase (GH16 family)